MESEVGMFLLKKIEDLEIEPKETFLQSQLDLSEDCKTLHGLIASKEITDLHNLYQLYNVISGWQKLLHDNAGSLKKFEFINTNREWLKKMIEEVQKLPAQTAETESLQPHSPTTYRWSSPSPPKIHGIEDRIKIMERLLDRKDRFNAIALVGMAGVGKTALCQVAFTEPLVKETYLPRIWVSLSKLPNQNGDEYKKEVVKRMLNCLGFIVSDEAREDLRVMIKLLRQQLKGKKYLIVLDDPWKDEFFKSLTDDVAEKKEDQREQLVYGLPKGHGGAVIVSTRYEEVAKDMVGEKNVVRVETLPDKESIWKIFMDALDRSAVPVPPGMEKVKDEILNSCGELPLVAKMMGTVVCDKLEDLKM